MPVHRLWFVCFLMWIEAQAFGNPVKNISAPISQSSIKVWADIMERNAKDQTITLKGNVQALFQGQYISSDYAFIDLKTKQIVAEGNVILQTEDIQAECRRIDFNFETSTGFFYEAVLFSGQIVFEGEIIEKVGPEEYVTSNGSYTTCKTCPGAWSFYGKRIRAELDRYAYVTLPVLRMGDFPVLPLPYMVFPLMSERQSGLLTPSYNFSDRGGSAFNQEYFWAISKSQDLTLGLTYFEKLGIKTDLEYRYILGEDSFGQFRGHHIRDREFVEDSPAESPIDRWFVNYEHLYTLPNDFIHRLKVNRASDLRYALDFPLDFTFENPINGDPALESEMSLTRNLENHHLSVSGIIYKNLLKANPLDAEQDEVHRIPDIRYVFKETRVLDTDLLFSTDARYVQFVRNGPSFDNISSATEDPNPCRPGQARCVNQRQDGFFNINEEEGIRDLLRAGQRLDVRSQLSYPFHLGSYLQVNPSLMYRETQYRFHRSAPLQVQGSALTDDFNYSDTAAQRYFEAQMTAMTRFSKVFGNESQEGTLFRHEVEPSLSYANMPWIRRAEHDFFGDFEDQPFYQIYEPIRDNDIFGRNRLQFDYDDRVFTRDLATVALTNRLVRRQRAGDDFRYRTMAELRISQSYDFQEGRRADEAPQPWTPVRSDLALFFDNVSSFTSNIYYPYAGVNNLTSNIRISNGHGANLTLSYLRQIFVDSRNRVNRDSLNEIVGFGSGFRTRYLDLIGQASYSLVKQEYLGWQAFAAIKMPGDCLAFTLRMAQPLNSPFQWNVNFALNFDGEFRALDAAMNQQPNF